MTPIDKTFFEAVLPAFETCGDEIFNRIQPTFDGVWGRLRVAIGVNMDTYLADPKLQDLAKRYVCVRAARLMIPQLDLILTQTGFGVVNTTNVAPASRDRVAALSEQLRQSESDTCDQLLLSLASSTDWRKSPEAQRLIRSLLWLPTILRTYGITAGGEPVWWEEYQALLPKIMAAEADLEQIISPELHQALIARLEPTSTETGSVYGRLITTCREYLAIHVAGVTTAVAVKGQQLQAYCNANVEALPEYANSALHKAHNTQRYENKKNARIHFW